jgi:hypothetical protein
MSILSAAADYLPFLPRPMPRFVTDRGNPVHAMVAEYENASCVFHAAEQVRDAGYKRWDVHAPFPIHGIEHAMGHRKTILPYIVFAVGIGGAFLGWAMQYWMTAVDYTGFTVQGKPYGAWEPFTMIIFELGVLHAAFAALIGMLMLNGLPRWNHPLFSSERFLETSQGKFMIVIEANDPAFDPDGTKALLQGTGGRQIALIEDED